MLSRYHRFTNLYGWWFDLVREVENKPGARSRTIDIEVSAVLAIGHSLFGIPNSAIVRDTYGKKWEVPETPIPGGLASRHDLRPGDYLRLVIEAGGKTQAFRIL